MQSGYHFCRCFPSLPPVRLATDCRRNIVKSATSGAAAVMQRCSHQFQFGHAFYYFYSEHKQTSRRKEFGEKSVSSSLRRLRAQLSMQFV